MSGSDYDPLFGCELAHGRRDRDGYVYAGSSRAHIVAYERANGPLADGVELDHTCRRRACRALIHLEPVSRSENERRKSWAYRTRIARCPRGHLLADTFIMTPEDGRVCRTCRDDAAREQA